MTSLSLESTKPNVFGLVTRLSCVAVAAAVVLVSGQLSKAQTNHDTIMVRVPWNPVKNPQGWDQVLGDCLDNRTCLTAAEAIGIAAGFTPGTVTASLELLSEAGGLLTETVAGEQFRTIAKAPGGYRVCDVKTSPIQSAPMGERRSPTFAATVQNDQTFELYSVVHRKGPLGGRSWVDTVATVKFVRIGSSLKPNATYAQERSTNTAAIKTVIKECRSALASHSGTFGFYSDFPEGCSSL